MFAPRQTQFAVFPLLFSPLPERTIYAFLPYFNTRLISYRPCRRFSCLKRLRSILRRHNEPDHRANTCELRCIRRSCDITGYTDRKRKFFALLLFKYMYTCLYLLGKTDIIRDVHILFININTYILFLQQ